MGIFDKMFGRGASEDEKSQKRFEELRNKYQSVLNLADQQQVQFQNLHIENDKLLIRAIAPSQDVANKLWDQIKLANPNLDDITADITVSQSAAQSAVTTGGQTAPQGGASAPAMPAETPGPAASILAPEAHISGPTVKMLQPAQLPGR